MEYYYFGDLENNATIEQIKRRQYPAKVAQYADNLMLVWITYERESKRHMCRIECYQ